MASVELAPNTGHEVAEVLRALDAELDRLAGSGPEGNEVAVAKFLVHARVQKELAWEYSTGNLLAAYDCAFKGNSKRALQTDIARPQP